MLLAALSIHAIAHTQGFGKDMIFMNKVSIIVAAYNSEKYILETLESIEKQTYKNYEVIIIDDFSTDNTKEIVLRFIEGKSNYKVYTNKKNQGTVCSRNSAIDKADGQYICILDSDDVWHEKKLEKQMEILMDESIDLCFTSYSFIDKDSKAFGRPYIIPYDTGDYEKLLTENYIGCSTIAIKSEVLKRYKFSEEFIHEDYHLWLKLLKDAFKFKGSKEVLVKYRVLPGSRSYNKFKSSVNRYAIYRQSEHLSFFRSIRLMFLYLFHSIKKRL